MDRWVRGGEREIGEVAKKMEKGLKYRKRKTA